MSPKRTTFARFYPTRLIVLIYYPPNVHFLTCYPLKVYPSHVLSYKRISFNIVFYMYVICIYVYLFSLKGVSGFVRMFLNSV